jgi:hypothetical protein
MATRANSIIGSQTEAIFRPKNDVILMLRLNMYEFSTVCACLRIKMAACLG